MTKSFKTGFTPAQLAHYQKGVMNYTYKNIGCLKSPIDLAIYIHLITHTKPKTIIEIGSQHGGSAILLYDIAKMVGEEAKVISIDIKLPKIEAPKGIKFLQGNVRFLEEVFEQENLYSLPRPWLVIEDSQHSYVGCLAAIKFFSAHLKPEEYLVIEDGVLEDLGWSEQFGGGPNRAIKEFLVNHPNEFEIDREYCDMFGPNMTYNPNGYLKKL